MVNISLAALDKKRPESFDERVILGDGERLYESQHSLSSTQVDRYTSLFYTLQVGAR